MEPNTDTTDIGALADTLHYLYGMNVTTARDILRDYIDQMKKYAGRPIDEDNISRDDADFLIESIKSARDAGELCKGELSEVEKYAADYRGMQEEADIMRELRDKAINAAVACGASKADVARAAGISKQAIAKIVRRG